MGVQLVGRRGDDARLLRTARWLVDWVRALERGRRLRTETTMQMKKIAKIVMGHRRASLVLAFFAPPVIKLQGPDMIIVILIGVVRDDRQLHRGRPGEGRH